MYPAYTRRWPNFGLTLAHRLRRWPNINLTLGQRPMFAWYVHVDPALFVQNNDV